jgi:hypothetical protein
MLNTIKIPFTYTTELDQTNGLMNQTQWYIGEFGSSLFPHSYNHCPSIREQTMFLRIGGFEILNRCNRK